MATSSLGSDDLKSRFAAAALTLQEPPKVRSRVRARSRVNNLFSYDVRGEVVNFFFNILRQQEVSIWEAYYFAYTFANEYKNELHSAIMAFDENCESFSWSDWHTLLVNCAMKFLHSYTVSNHEFLNKPVDWDKFAFSTFEHRNNKPTMEDRKLLLPKLCIIEPGVENTYQDAALFGVFDGHGGAECADYCVAHFPECLINVQSSTASVDDLLPNAFKAIDKRINYFCTHESLSGGTTASVALIHDNVVHYAWIGDSGIGLLKGDHIIQLSCHHNLSNIKEEERVIAAGSEILFIYGEKRVDGVLNITRALGHPCATSIISEPDVGKFEIGPDDFILFIASDGIWDVSSKSEMLADIVSFVKANSPGNFADLATAIGTPIRKQSIDNCMLLLVFLKPVEEIWEHFSKL